MRKNKFAAIISLLILLSSLSALINTASSQETKVKVEPSLIEYYTKATGKEFTIAVKIIDVENLYGFDIKLRWNTTYLEYVSRSVHVPKNTYLDGVLWNPIIQVADEVNVTEGTYWIGYASISPAPTFNGTGTVFTMTFRIKYHPVEPEQDANITLELYETDLAAYGGEPIPHTREHGTVILHALPPVETILIVQPTAFRKSQGATFTVNVSIEDVTDLYGYDISLYYNTTLLDALSVAEGPFLKSVGNTVTIVSEVNDAVGRVRMAVALLGAPAGANGSGTLFTITFKASTTATGPSALSLQNTELSNYNMEPIDHAVIDGQVTILLVEILTHAVEVEGVTYYFVTASSSSITDFEYNHTERTVSFSATGPEDILGFTNITMPKALLSLPSGDTFIVMFDGKAIFHIRKENTTHYFLYFTYQHTSGKTHQFEIKRTLIGDLNGDRKVTIADVTIVATAYDATPADARWNPLADLAYPWGKINIYDVVAVTRVYGKIWTP